eukprot:s2458_g2.t1
MFPTLNKYDKSWAIYPFCQSPETSYFQCLALFGVIIPDSDSPTALHPRAAAGSSHAGHVAVPRWAFGGAAATRRRRVKKSSPSRGWAGGRSLEDHHPMQSGTGRFSDVFNVWLQSPLHRKQHGRSQRDRPLMTDRSKSPLVGGTACTASQSIRNTATPGGWAPSTMLK